MGDEDVMLVLNRDHFDHMTGADRALQIEVLGLFRMQVEAWVAILGQGACWRDAVHTMKGSARGIGLEKLAAACEAAERAPETETARALFDVRASLDEALIAVQDFTAEAA